MVAPDQFPDLTCGSCLCNASNPVEVKCCDRIFCWECVVHLEHCACGAKVNPAECVARPDLEERVDAFVNCEHGCDFSASRRVVESHQLSCGYRMMPCPAEGCTETIRVCDLNSHRRLCPYSNVPCPFCECLIPPLLLESHQLTCFERPIYCQCGESLVARLEDEHKTTCTHAQIDCPMKDCSFQCLRKDLPDHISGDCFNKVLSLVDEVKQKDEQIALLTQRVESKCSLASVNIRDEIVQTHLWQVGSSFCQNLTKRSLCRVIVFLLLLQLVPLKRFLARFIVFVFLLNLMWSTIMKPTLTRARDGTNPFGVIGYVALFSCFLWFVWKWLIILA